MESQYNFQMKSRNDRTEWEQVAIYFKIHCDRTKAIHYARSLSLKFNKEIRLTQGADPMKTSGTYIYEKS
ncbi:addiction module toxin RelE [Chryseobacterium pennae]|uniref:Addiction module toxin RelE n=1 Tax=Chryseobacterium pennae TaxID=2258962 RepID=A0A3D9C2P9_9FLAO|nr:hypothetical protein [Chryseobacterium pennae]REC60130.1 addiction module toxin RelE [Chryseobacterium pennae]